MRRLATTLFSTSALLAALAFSGPAAAESEFLESMGDWASDSSNTFLAGLNGFITGPADPVMETWHVNEEYETLPVAAVSGRFIGFFRGMLVGMYRGGMGVMDMVLAPLPMEPLSPEPRYSVIPGFEIED